MRRADLLLAAVLVCAATMPAAAQENVEVNLPGGRLSDALIALAEQAGASIGTSDTGLAAIRTSPLRGRMTLRTALDRLLAGTGYRYAFVGPRIISITRARPAGRAARRQPSPSATPIPAPPPSRPAPDIVITASKRGTALDRFGGTAYAVAIEEGDAARFGARGTDTILELLPMLASTSLGPGRDKIYIRGLADSSFNGPSQSIVGQYLGEARLTFNAPDPNLNLYDMKRVEVLEGPQDTLYGSGSLGGILRLIPNAPDPSGQAASAATGLLVTKDGGWGSDLAAMVDLPLARDRIGLRLVGYGSNDAGYVDDLQRGLRDVNRTRTFGGRARLLWEAGDSWRIEVGALAQTIIGRDGQYAVRDAPPLTRGTNFAQPFNNDYLMGDLTVRKRWDRTELVSATGFVNHNLENRFDATGFPGTTEPQVYDETIGIALVSNETRLSRPDPNGLGWLIGWSLLRSENRISRALGPPGAQRAITGVRNETGEVALFGQYGLRLASRWNATLGGRLTFASLTGAPIDNPDDEEASRMDVWAAPMAELTWRAGPRLTLYARYQEGFRAGGLALSPTGAPSAAQRFLSDNLGSIDIGLRHGRREVDRFSLSAAASYATWQNIQADLVDSSGLIYTTNIGDGRIFSLELDMLWRATPSLSLEVAGFLNDSELSAPAGEVIDDDTSPALPNIARAGARVAARYQTRLTSTASLTIDGSARYVGRSRLASVGPTDLYQGDYVNGRIGARIDFGGVGMTLDVDNVADVRGNRFSFGNPFTVAEGDQITPLRPRTFRIGFDVRY